MITKEEKAFPGPFILLPLLCCSFLVLDGSPAAAVTPSCLCWGEMVLPASRGVLDAIINQRDLLWHEEYFLCIYSGSLARTGDPKLAGPTAALLSFKTLHKFSPLNPSCMLEHLWLCSRWQCSIARCQDEPVHFSIVCISLWSSRKRGKNTPTWQLMCGSFSPVVGSQQYEHIDSNNWGISKRRSPETAGPYWHGGHSPEENLQSQLKFQPQIPKQLTFSPDFPMGGAENVPLVQHWNGTFSWHCTFPICSLHPLSSHCVSALACFWAHDAVELKNWVFSRLVQSTFSCDKNKSNLQMGNQVSSKECTWHPWVDLVQLNTSILFLIPSMCF